jgi:hypothetical protein
MVRSTGVRALIAPALPAAAMMTSWGVLWEREVSWRLVID